MAKDIGPLDWKTPIVDSGGKPSPEFQRRWATQRGNNGLIGFITVSDGAPAGTPLDGQEYVDTSEAPLLTLNVAGNGTWHPVGVGNFTQLDDVPGNYTSAAGKLLTVNGNATGVEFATTSAVLDLLGNATGDILVRGNSTWAGATLSAVLDEITTTRGSILYRGVSGWQALAPGNLTQVLGTGGAGADPSWVAQSGGGGGGGAGNPPTIVQHGFTDSGSSTTVTLPNAPTPGNLLVALVTAGGNGAATGWTSITSNAGGAVFGLIATKVAGVGESTAQTPGTAGGAAVVMWELNGQNATGPIVFASSGVAGSSPFAASASIPGLKDVLALGAITGDGGAIAFNALLNMTQDVSSAGTKGIVAGHSDGSTPVAQALTTLVAGNTRNHLISVTR